MRVLPVPSHTADKTVSGGKGKISDRFLQRWKHGGRRMEKKRRGGGGGGASGELGREKHREMEQLSRTRRNDVVR